ncbi:MAG: hypothetical protein H7Z42_04830 [Roseiflexaceae bacterium]|nr:hypothetical protein [Roseiflexaceae bacterium]
MYLANHNPARAVAPLDELELRDTPGGRIIISDGARRVYLRSVASSSLRFTVGGAAGRHTILNITEDNRLIERVYFQVEAVTRIDDEGGEFAELLDTAYLTMIGDAEMGQVRWNGRVYHFFVRWLRDHVHTLKGMKYFHSRLRDGIDLFRESQRADGMIWDNVYPREPTRHWDDRFSAGDFIQVSEDGTVEFKRIPVEADVEYLFVEGLYFTWKATGDDLWMQHSLDAAVRALDYCVTSPLRWSAAHGLIKRGYTIDTWDFQAEDDATVSGDPMRIDAEKTRFGIMFGDNTGYIAACRSLAEMLELAERGGEAERFRQRAGEMQSRLNEVSWDGQFFIHHVPEQYGLVRDLGVDEDAQLSLSNAYSLNRGIGQEQAAAIIRAYQALRNQLPEGAPGEWYTIYPPFERGYGGHNSTWQYMNGGVTPIVAGELARGALAHGFERYGVDVLRRVAALANANGGRIDAVYTGAYPASPATRFSPLDISARANIDTKGEGAEGVPGWTGEGENDLHELPGGDQTFAGVPFSLPDPATNGRRAALGLRRAPGYAAEITLEIGATAAAVYLLHTVSATKAGGVGGTITLHYADGATHTEYIVRGVNVSGWWYPEAPQQHGPRSIALAWQGRNASCRNIGLLAYGLNNPRPQQPIERISLRAADDGAFWAVCGITLADQPPAFPADPVSFGIPDNWAAAAVTYGLIEGLAGVVDEATAFNSAQIAPRWLAAEIDSALVTVAYPASGGYVAYRYEHDRAGRQIVLTVTGSGERVSCRLLLPAYAQHVTVAVGGGGELASHLSLIEQSRYAEFELALLGAAVVTVGY